jgi:cytoskeletal protein CcmA (bactofilin family)
MSAIVDAIPSANKLTVGEGVTIKGALVVCETVVVDGILEGDITTDNLIVSATGTVSGRISVARNAEISGRILEKLDVKGLLVLQATGCIEGNVSFGALTLEQGASITGEVSSNDHRANPQSSYRAMPNAARPNAHATARSNGVAAAVTPSPLDLALDLIPGPINANA